MANDLQNLGMVELWQPDVNWREAVDYAWEASRQILEYDGSAQALVNLSARLPYRHSFLVSCFSKAEEVILLDKFTELQGRFQRFWFPDPVNRFFINEPIWANFTLKTAIAEDDETITVTALGRAANSDSDTLYILLDDFTLYEIPVTAYSEASGDGVFTTADPIADAVALEEVARVYLEPRSISVDATGWAATGDDWIYLLLADDSLIARSVLSYSELSGNGIFELLTPLDRNISVAEVNLFSGLYLCRLDNDTLELQYHAKGVAEGKLVITEIPRETSIEGILAPSLTIAAIDIFIGDVTITLTEDSDPIPEGADITIIIWNDPLEGEPAKELEGTKTEEKVITTEITGTEESWITIYINGVEATSERFYKPFVFEIPPVLYTTFSTEGLKRACAYYSTSGAWEDRTLSLWVSKATGIISLNINGTPLIGYWAGGAILGSHAWLSGDPAVRGAFGDNAVVTRV